jgi:hypothetical protein
VIEDNKISILDAFEVQGSLVKIIAKEAIEIMAMKYEYEAFENYFVKQ